MVIHFKMKSHKGGERDEDRERHKENDWSRERERRLHTSRAINTKVHFTHIIIKAL